MIWCRATLEDRSSSGLTELCVFEERRVWCKTTVTAVAKFILSGQKRPQLICSWHFSCIYIKNKQFLEFKIIKNYLETQKIWAPNCAKYGLLKIGVMFLYTNLFIYLTSAWWKLNVNGFLSIQIQVTCILLCCLSERHVNLLCPQHKVML